MVNMGQAASHYGHDSLPQDAEHERQMLDPFMPHSRGNAEEPLPSALGSPRNWDDAEFVWPSLPLTPTDPMTTVATLLCSLSGQKINDAILLSKQWKSK